MKQSIEIYKNCAFVYKTSVNLQNNTKNGVPVLRPGEFN